VKTVSGKVVRHLFS